MKFLCFVVLALTFATIVAWGQFVSSGSFTTSGGANWGLPGMVCGPPQYLCSRTDLSVAPILTVPDVTAGANTVATDPQFGGRILRMTDGNTDSSSANASFVATYSGGDIDNRWNSNSTLLAFGRTGGSNSYVTSFNPATMQVGATFYLVPSKAVAFPDTNPNVLYDFEFSASPAMAAIKKYDFTSGLSTPTVTTVYDFSQGDCINGYAPTAQTFFTIAKDDQTFMIGMGDTPGGAQNTAVLVAVYKVGSGCRVYNTSNATDGGVPAASIVGDWGPTGAITMTGGTSNPDEYTLHEVTGSLNGSFLILAQGTCLNSCGSDAPFLWQTNTVSVIPSNTSGHYCQGYNLFIHGNNSPQGQMAIATIANPPVNTNLITTANLGTPGVSALDIHCSWNNDSSSDTAFVVQANTSTGALSGIGPVNGVVGSFSGPFVNEILGYPTSAPGSSSAFIRRFAHSFISAISASFSAQEAIGTVSQDGRFFMFTSDWMGTLGSSSGGRSCIAGGPKWVASSAYSTTTVAACTRASYSNTSCISPANANGNVFAATTGGTSGSTAPNWPSALGTTVSDGTIVWTNAGPANCRQDVFVAELR